MTEPFFSTSWYRVADLRPRLRGHVKLHRHVYRGRRSYVLEDPASGRNHRLSQSAHLLIGLMDGERTVQEAWDLAVQRLGDDAPSQDEAIRLLGLLHLSDALLCDVPPDTEVMFRRNRRRARDERWQRFANPLAIRVPLFDPDGLLSRLAPMAAPLFSGAGLAIAAACVAFGAGIAATHADELMADTESRLLAAANLPLLLVLYAAVKAVHELGHGIVAKRYGCEIHEMGIVFLVLAPMPYVDATSTAVLPAKRQRMAVSAAGIGVELVIAGLAAITWWAVEPGVVRGIAHDLVFVCSVSTLAFNGNPLMRFDAYYVLADAVEIPNLASRSRQYVASWFQRHFFSMEHVRDPVEVRSEVPWLAAYGVASLLYRTAVVLAIALFVSTRFFVIGAILALVAIATQLVVPALRQIDRVLREPRFDAHRTHIVSAVGGGLAVLLLAVTLLPLPQHSVVEGVVWPPEGTQLRAQEAGFVVDTLRPSGARVEAGEPLLRTRDPLFDSQLRALEARVRELRASVQGHRIDDLVRSQIDEEQLATALEELEQARERQAEMLLRSPASGRLVLGEGPDLVGRWVEQGDLLGYVVNRDEATARVVVSEQAVDLVRNRTRAVRVRRASRPEEVERAILLREIPAAEDRLPHAALGTAGGGGWVVDPADPDALESPEPVFQFDLALGGAGSGRIGERVWARFEHDPEPLARRLLRGTRRLLLSRLGV